MKVSKTVIDFTEANVVNIGGKNATITLTIDGERMFADQAKTVQKIVVTRLQNQGEQVTVPIMTFLPLREPEFERLRFSDYAAQLKDM